MAIFLRLMTEEDKDKVLAEAVSSVRGGRYDSHIHQPNASLFTQVPGAPFAYWVTEAVRSLFAVLSSFEGEDRTARQGIATADDFRFVRLWSEVSARTLGERWFPFAKGGAFSPFYADIHLVINWGYGGSEVRYFDRAFIRNEGSYFRPGLTWPLRTQSGLALRVMATGCIFGHKGPAAFVDDDDPRTLLALLAVTNSRAFRTLVELLMAFGSYEVGVIQRTPVPDLGDTDQRVLAELAHRAWSLKRGVDSAELTSHAFEQPALLQADGASLSERADAWSRRVADTERELADIQTEIDQRCFDLYGFEPADREMVRGEVGIASEASEEADNEDTDSASAVDAEELAAALVDWLVGTAFGRFDVRRATGEREPPNEPEPFDPLPVCSPGMLTDERGLPLGRAPEGYPLDLPPNGVLVDDPGIQRDIPTEWDILRRVQAVLVAIFGDRASDIKAELCDLLGVRDLRSYLRRPASFFADHLSRYSKSRRKAPIYWPLSTASGSYTLWVYYPRLSEDTLYIAINEHVSPKIAEVEERLAQLGAERDRVEGREATRVASRIGELTELLDELKELREELRQVAALPYRPDLNDGVQITAAPLWRVFRHRPWRSLLERTWRELSDGKYDWAHLAHAIWPDRVRDACRNDRSLAIAHGLEDLYKGEL